MSEIIVNKTILCNCCINCIKINNNLPRSGMELDGSSSIPRSCLLPPPGSSLIFGGGGGGGGRMTADAEGPGGEDVEDVTMDADGIRNSFTEDGSSVLKIIVVCISTATLKTTVTVSQRF